MSHHLWVWYLCVVAHVVNSVFLAIILKKVAIVQKTISLHDEQRVHNLLSFTNAHNWGNQIVCSLKGPLTVTKLRL